MPTDQKREGRRKSRPAVRRAAFDAKKYITEINSGDHLRIIVSGQIYIEAALMELIELALPYPEDIDWQGLNFPRKLELAVALDVLHPAEALPYRKVNELRNKLAHELSAVVTIGDVDDLFRSMTPGMTHMLEDAVGGTPRPGLHLLQALVVLFTQLQSRLEVLAARGKPSSFGWRKVYPTNQKELLSE